MVDDLLDVARLERGKMQLQRERMDLNAAVTAAVDACLPIIQAAGHRVRVSLAGEALRIDGDPVRIEQVITNLLTNAAKFTLDAGEIAVESRRDGETAVVSVRDSGIGLQPEMIDAAFHPFTQGEETLARTGGGLGIGLTIARRLTELHGGAMEARSEGKHKGSTFLIRVPLVAAGVSAPAVQASAGRDAKRRRVLIVEDNADIRESLRMMVDLWGHEVLTAECGREGVAMADRERPEIALIDIGLPGMSGYEVAQAIRGMSMKDGALPIKLIAVTGYGQPSDKQRSLESGFNAHLLKPVDPHALQLILSEGAIAGA
jgi:CheY-like chemotaxis protein